MTGCALPRCGLHVRRALARGVRRVWRGLCVGALILGASMAGSLPARADTGLAQQLAEAQRLARQGQPDAARVRLEAAARDHPTRPEPWINLASLALAGGEAAQARAHLETALRTTPAYAQAFDALQQLNAQLAQQAYAHALQPSTTPQPLTVQWPWAMAEASASAPVSPLPSPTSPREVNPMPTAAPPLTAPPAAPASGRVATATERNALLSTSINGALAVLLLALLTGSAWAAQRGASASGSDTAAAVAGAQPAPPPAVALSPEAELIEVYRLIGQGDLSDALRRAERLVQVHPHFQLAQLTYGDLLLARNGTLVEWGATAAAHRGMDTSQLKDEARLRLKALRELPAPDTVPAQVLQLGSSTRHVVAVDASRARLYVLEHIGGVLQRVAHHYIAIGSLGVGKRQENDQRTPLGVYYTTNRLDGRQLGDFYGVGALPLNYPNDHDRHLGRTGANIWLHGTPSAQLARAPRSTNGCIVLANDDLARWLQELVPQHTPVVIARQLDWVHPRSLAPARQAALAAIEQWRLARAQASPQRLLALYAQHFDNGEQGLDAWRARLLDDLQAHGGREREIQDLSLLTWHEDTDVLVATFTEVLRGSRPGPTRRQYWSRASGQWKIFSEGLLE